MNFRVYVKNMSDLRNAMAEILDSRKSRGERLESLFSLFLSTLEEKLEFKKRYIRLLETKCKELRKKQKQMKNEEEDDKSEGVKRCACCNGTQITQTCALCYSTYYCNFICQNNHFLEMRKRAPSL